MFCDYDVIYIDLSSDVYLVISSAPIPQLTYVGAATGLLGFFLFDWLSTSGLAQ